MSTLLATLFYFGKGLFSLLSMMNKKAHIKCLFSFHHLLKSLASFLFLKKSQCLCSVKVLQRDTTFPLSALSEPLFLRCHPLTHDDWPETSWNLSYVTRETHTLQGHHNTGAAQTGLGLLWQIEVSGLTWVMCCLISTGIVLTKQVSA